MGSHGSSDSRAVMEELLGSVREVPVTSGDRPSLFWSSRFWCCTLLDPLGGGLVDSVLTSIIIQ
jgi:hypothetical protein